MTLALFTPRCSVFMSSIQLFFCNTEPITLLVRLSVNPEIRSAFLIAAVRQGRPICLWHSFHSLTPLLNSRLMLRFDACRWMWCVNTHITQSDTQKHTVSSEVRLKLKRGSCADLSGCVFCLRVTNCMCACG